MADSRLQPPPAAFAFPTDETASSKAAGDRLTSTLFLAVLLHGVIIMGVSFTPGDEAERSQVATSLEVVLVPEDPTDRPDPEDARLLASQSLLGSGNTQDEAARTAVEGAMTLERRKARTTDPGQQTGETQATHQLTRPNPDLIASAVPSPDESARMNPANPGSDTPSEMLASPDLNTRIPDAEPRQLFVSANTRESRIAAYLEGWKGKVERVGTMNYPSQLVPGATGAAPTLEVAVASNGTLREVVILVPSGSARLDQAAMEILRLAAPFEPFPEFLRNEYDVLRFAYQWRFSEGTMTGRVTVPAR